MTDWGVSAGYHDAALSVIKDGKIVFAGHAERYSRKKNDKSLNAGLINDALQFGEPDQVFWFENPLLKATVGFRGQGNWWTNPRSILKTPTILQNKV